jgi:integrase
MTHEISEGFVRQVGRNYYMILTVDGQRKQRKTGTNDLDKATEMLAEWRAQEKAGVAASGSRMRYEEMRDEYVKNGGKVLQTGVQRDLDTFFKGIYVNAINAKKLDQFRAWREAQERVLESKAETLEKEIALRTMKAGKRKLAAEQVAKIKSEATVWVENGVQATTDKRLRILRAMFGYIAKKGLVHKNDIPHFPIKGSSVDNKNRTFLGEKDLKGLLENLDGVYHPFVRFLYATGMRSGQASKLTWDMVDEKTTQLHVPGELTKNGEDFVLPLVYKNGEPMFDFVKDIKRMVRVSGDPIFETTDFRSHWRQACDKLGLGIFNKETRAYRGAKPHDFRRTACRNMVIAGIPQPVAMAISGHKTDSIFRRYAIMDKSAVQEAFETLQAR